MIDFSNRKFLMRDYLSIPFQLRRRYVIFRIIDLVAVSMIPAVCTFLTADFINKATDVFYHNASKMTLVLPISFLLICLMIQHLNDVWVKLLSQNNDRVLRSVYETALLQKRSVLSYQHIENTGTWELLSRVSAAFQEKMNEGFATILTFISQIIYMVSLLFILMRYVWWAGLLLFAVCIPLILYAKKAGCENYTAYTEADRIGRRADYLNGILNDKDNAPERTLFQYKERIQKEWTVLENEARNLVLKANLMHIAKMKAGSILASLVSIIIIGVFLVQFLHGLITAGVLIAVIGAMISLVPLLSWNLSDSMLKLEECRYFLNDLTVFFGLEEEAALSRDIEDIISFSEIRFEHVSFKYPNTERYIIKDFSFTFRREMHYAIVGLNGSGKTTLIKLMLGLYDTFEGDILINQQSIRKLSRQQINAVFSVVFQDYAKYMISIRDSIMLGSEQLCDHETSDGFQLDKIFNRVLHTLEIDKLFAKLPMGAETLLGKIYQEGVDLSGGEWQKIAIMRGILKNSKVHILDEPTAALDPSAEQAIYELFRKECAKDTTIVITHRLGAAKSADVIVVLADGVIKETGNHDMLIAQNGLYAEMYESQKGWYQ